MQRSFDPYWTNAIKLIDLLHDKELISDDVTACAVGGFVLVEGSLTVMDLSIVKPMWGLKSVVSMMAKGSGSRQQRRAPMQLDEHGKLVMEVLPLIPYSIVAIFDSNQFRTWSSIQAEGLVGTPSNLILNHGCEIAGRWTMIGILDALPDEDQRIPDDIDSLSISDGITSIVVAFSALMRESVGRPRASYGVTPILIYRQVDTE